MATTPLSGTRVAGAGALLAVLGRVASERLRDALTDSGLRPRQYQALALLREDGPRAQQALGEAMGVDPSILVTLLNPLEDEGLLTRRRDRADRRRHIVGITEAGEARFQEAERTYEAAQDELLSALDSEQRAQLQSLLAVLERSLAVAADACDSADEASGC